MDTHLAFMVIVGLLWAGAGLLFVVAHVLFLLDRHALTRGQIGVFRRGMLVGRRCYRPSSPIVSSIETIRTGQGQGRWLTVETFGFWPREGYSYSGFEFSWVGLASVRASELAIEANLMRGLVLSQLGWLLAAVALPLTFAASGMTPLVLALGVSALMVRLVWRAFQRQRRVAEEVMKEFGTRLLQSNS
jgi:hypothetical protein